MIFYFLNGPQNAGNSVRALENQNFPREHDPGPPRGSLRLRHSVVPPIISGFLRLCEVGL